MRLKKIRKEYRISALELAKAAQINPSTLSKIENAWIELTPEQTKKIVAGFSKLGVQVTDKEITRKEANV